MENDTLDFENPNSLDVRFLSAYRAWYMATLASYQAMQQGELIAVLGSLPSELGWVLELDTAWQELAGDDYRTTRDASETGPVLSALAATRTAWGWMAALHVSEAEVTDPLEVVRWRPVEHLPEVADPTVVLAYTEHLQGRALSETARVVAELFLHTPEVMTGRAEKLIRMLLPAEREENRKAVEQTRRMVEEHPDLVEVEQQALGYRHLTVVHGEFDEEAPPREFYSYKALLSMFTSAPPPFYIGYGKDRIVLVVGGPQANRTMGTMEMLLRLLAPQTDGGGPANPDWEFIRGFAPGDDGPRAYITNDTTEQDDTTPE